MFLLILHMPSKLRISSKLSFSEHFSSSDIISLSKLLYCSKVLANTSNCIKKEIEIDYRLYSLFIIGCIVSSKHSNSYGNM